MGIRIGRAVVNINTVYTTSIRTFSLFYFIELWSIFLSWRNIGNPEGKGGGGGVTKAKVSKGNYKAK